MRSALQITDVLADAVENPGLLGGLSSVQWTLGGLLGLSVLLVLTGGLVPWRTHKLVVEQNKVLQSTVQSQQDTIRIQSEQLARFTELGTTTVKLLEALPSTEEGDA